jgi:hypothetical protein
VLVDVVDLVGHRQHLRIIDVGNKAPKGFTCARFGRRSTSRPPVEEVWSVLVDFASYQEWNPFIILTG